MILALSLLIIQNDLPKTWGALLERINAAYRDLSNYTDTWRLMGTDGQGQQMKFLRMIDGRRASILVTLIDPATKQDTPLFAQGTDGVTEYFVAYTARSYYVGKDDIDRSGSRSTSSDESGTFKLGLDLYGLDIHCKPELVLKSIETNPGEVAKGRIATAEVVSPSGNKITLRMSLLNRWWLPSDITATLQMGNSDKRTVNLHADLIGMDAKFPKHAFEFDPSWVKGFTKKTKNEVLKDFSNPVPHD